MHIQKDNKRLSSWPQEIEFYGNLKPDVKGISPTVVASGRRVLSAAGI
ncbi:MAG: hypothetical protein PVH43_07655 [Desulfobacterales bacterium]